MNADEVSITILAEVVFRNIFTSITPVSVSYKGNDEILCHGMKVYYQHL